MDTVGDRIKIIRKMKRLNQKAFARLIDLKNAIDVSRLEKNQRKHTSTILVNISKKCNISLDWLLLGIGDMYKKGGPYEIQQQVKKQYSWAKKTKQMQDRIIPVRPVPILNTVPAGFPETPIDDFIIDWVLIPMELKDPKAFALVVTGKSMYPKIDDGEIIIISPQTKVSSGQIGAFRINGDVTIKKLLVKEEATYLIAENDEYPPIVLKEGDELTAIGRAVYQVKKIE